MEPPTKTEPPFVPLRHTGWASHRTPLWVFAVIIVLVVGTVVVSLVRKPSPAQRAGDLTGYFSDVSTGIESCAGGARDAITAFNTVEGGDTSRLSDTVDILDYNGQNCSPMNNQSLSDFTSYQVTESLAQFPLQTADNDVVSWAADALNAQQDMLNVLQASPATLATEKAALESALHTMDAQRTAIYAIWQSAEKATGATAPLPYLPT